MKTRIRLTLQPDGLQWHMEWNGPGSNGKQLGLWGSAMETFSAAARVMTGTMPIFAPGHLPADWKPRREIRITQRSDDLWIISEGRRYSQCFDDCEAIGALAFVIQDHPLPVPYTRLTSHADHVRQQPWAYRRAGQQYLPEGVSNE